ncbi:MAG: hypothetical protein JW993_01315 [Sedimentisphaerales bacterium]|nr:hypothetical protein [Sedimentisphaerales bacterium]
MAEVDIAQELSRKGADVEGIVARVIAEPRQIPALIEGVQAPKGTLRYGYEKVLRLIAERRPELVYPWFDVFAGLLDCGNSFLKWGAILTLGHLASADTEGKFEAIFARYYAPIPGPAMITAANIIGSSARIVRAKPHLIDPITCEILKVEKGRYLSKGRLSPECRNVVIGHAIDTLETFFDQITGRPSVLKFVQRQLKNPRQPVAKKAARFLQAHTV